MWVIKNNWNISLHGISIHSLSSEVSVEFNPTTYSVTEGVDGCVRLTVIRTGIVAVSVTAAVTTQPGTAEGWAVDGDTCDICVL